MRLIDADEIRWVDHYDSDGNLSKYKVAFSDEMPPTVDAVPVIRCKDCIRYREYTYLGTQKVYVCERDYRKRIFDMNADDFCSRGEKRW